MKFFCGDIKTKLLVAIAIPALLSAGGCSNICGNSELILYRPAWPAGQQGAVSLVVKDHNVTNNHNYNHFQQLQQYKFKATFFVNSALIKIFAEKPANFIFWARLKEYADNGHELALNHYGKCDEKMVEDILQCRDILQRKLQCNVQIYSCSKYSLGHIPTKYILELERNGMIFNRYSFYRTMWLPPTTNLHNNMSIAPCEIGEEAVANSEWVQALLPLEVVSLKHTAAAAEYCRKLFADLQKRQVMVAPVGTIERFRRGNNDAHYRIFASRDGSFRLQLTGGGSKSYITVNNNKNLSLNARSLKKVNNSGDTATYEVDSNETIDVLWDGKADESACLRTVKIAEYPGNAKASFTLTFDDTQIKHLTDWAPLLRKYKLPATFFLYLHPTKLLDKYGPQFAALQKENIEIGCHSYIHMTKDGKIANMPEKAFREDTIKAVTGMKKYGFKGASYCYPGNYHSRMSRRVVGEHFKWQVKNERNSISPGRMQFNAADYWQLLKQTRSNFVEMIHMPFYCNEDFKTPYTELFKIASADKEVSVTTYAAMRQYQYARRKAQIKYLEVKKYEQTFIVSSPIDCQLTLLLNNVNVSDNICAITADGKKLDFKRNEQGQWLFDAPCNKEIIVKFYK